MNPENGRLFHSIIQVLARRSCGKSCSQSIVLDDASTVVIYGRVWSRVLYYTYIFLCFTTLGLLGLVGYWIPKVYVYLVTWPGKSFSHSTHLLACCHHMEEGRTEWTFIKIASDISIDFSKFKVDCYNNDICAHDISRDIEESSLDINVQGHVKYFLYHGHRFVYYLPKKRFFCSSRWSANNTQWRVNDSSGSVNSHRKELIAIFGMNDIDISYRSFISILFHEVLQPYYIFLYSSIFVWFCEEYYYYAALVFILSTITAIVQANETRKNISNVREIVKQIYCPVKIWLDNQWISKSSRDLVMYDLFQVDMEYFPCDATIETGECLVDESILTGESTPTSKRADSTYVATLNGDRAINILSNQRIFSGTRILHVRSLNGSNEINFPTAKVTGIGFNTTKGTLVRHILYPRPSKYKFYREAIYILTGLAIMAIIGVVLSAARLAWLEMGYKVIIFRLFDLFTTLVPPSLPISITCGTVIAITRLRKKDIYCTESPRINVSGGLNLFCFDKTGTLTESSLEMKGFQRVARIQLPTDEQRRTKTNVEFEALIESSLELNQQNASNTTSDTCSKMLELGMASCHSIKILKGELAGDPLDMCMFKYTKWTLKENDNIRIISEMHSPMSSTSTVDVAYTILKIFEFFSSLKRMSVVIRDSQGNVFGFVKGAPETIKNICTQSTIPSCYDNVLQRYCLCGYHVISMGFKILSSNATYIRETVEKDLTFLGLFVFENKLKPDTFKSILALKKGGIKVVMCTGDNLLAAVSVAKECGILKENSEVYVPNCITKDQIQGHITWENVLNRDKKLSHESDLGFHSFDAKGTESNEYGLGCDGNSLDFIIKHYSKEYLSKVLRRCLVFGRMTPSQKGLLVNLLKEEKYVVGYCGDGANDCNALVAADVGLALSKSEASVAAPFTCKITSIKCSVDLVLEGRSALCTSFSVFKFIILMSFIDFTAVFIMYMYGSNLSMGQYIYIDLVLRFPLAICIGYMKSARILAPTSPPTSLYHYKILCSLFGQVIIQLSFQYIGYVLISNKSWYVKPKLKVEGADNPIPNHLNASIFLSSVFQYLIVAILFCSNEPHQLSIFKNRPLTLYTMVTLVLNIYLLLFPSRVIMDLIGIVDLDINYRVFILGFALVNCIASYFIHIYACKLYEKISFFLYHRKNKLSDFHSEA